MKKKQPFKIVSDFQPAGDQPQAIDALTAGLEHGDAKQTLLGVTGSGKTFTMAHVIERIQKPTLVIAHNKTLAAQLAQEFQMFFPDNAVHYFVSYYDYYQPEAYMPITDTYIEKDASINEEIDRLRHASTQSLLTRDDVIIVASVSCIYGLGSPDEYRHANLCLEAGAPWSLRDLMERLISMHYERTTADLTSGTFRVLGNRLEIMPVSETTMYSMVISGGRIESLIHIDPVTSRIYDEALPYVFIFPAKHFLTEGSKKEQALVSIEQELTERIAYFEAEGKVLEAERIKRRTTYDLAMIREIGYTNGIENYSRHLSGKGAGEPPDTLLSYFPHDADGVPQFLTIIDESHVTLPQLRAMYAGDQSRKQTLVDFGFRLPSAKDNRPLRFEEFEARVGQQIYVSATPGDFEKTESARIVEQVIRPTGLVDPQIEIRPVTGTADTPGQVQDFIETAFREIEKGGRVLVTTLTKKMAEDLAQYLDDKKIKSAYIHSDVKTIERIKIITDLRKGVYDILVGVNLLREGLDMPEVTLIGILDADKEGFLRSETSLIQTIGRAARNVDGRVIIYADKMTGSLERALAETTRRRDKQLAYNKAHGITPKTITKTIRDITEHMQTEHEKSLKRDLDADLAGTEKMSKAKKTAYIKKLLKQKNKEMNAAAQELQFETAALLRDEIIALEKMIEDK
ncbi:MAG: excinuclease ABC subunit UvrB [Candidatus Pacebacteria bacterium]|nr:excinuclease ABC subunit UvrB [Candidatus Paceibacterota bacterium]MCD8563782.1 excinuclease ABC subunit UvrB [Candidatus Paceibacterota bacterium]